MTLYELWKTKACEAKDNRDQCLTSLQVNQYLSNLGVPEGSSVKMHQQQLSRCPATMRFMTRHHGAIPVICKFVLDKKADTAFDWLLNT